MITEVAKRFRTSRIKVIVKVNSEMLRLYWSLGYDINELGKYISERKS